MDRLRVIRHHRVENTVRQRPSPEAGPQARASIHPLQRLQQTAGNRALQGIVEEVLLSPGQPLDPATRAYFEPLFSHDFSGLRVHSDASAAESTQAVNALAYTVGPDIVFGSGQYRPGTAEGRAILAHELTHVVQQDAERGPVPGSRPLRLLPPSHSLETDAAMNAQDLVAGKAVKTQRVRRGTMLMRVPAGPGPDTPPVHHKPSHLRKKSTGTERRELRRLIARDDYLRRLAASPGDALLRWRRLQPGDRMAVANYMALFYGLGFARRFVEEGTRRRHPETVITVTNWQTPEYLRARGYVFAESNGYVQFWVHPSGNETWVLPSASPARSATAVEEKEPAPAQDPGVQEAQAYADDFTAGRDRLVDQLAQLRRSVGTPEYARLFRQYFQAFDEWQNQLNPIIDERIAQLEHEADPQSKEVLAEQIQRLRDLLRWKQEEWPQSVSGLPQP